MHSYLFRLNAALTFAISALAVICIATSMTDFLHHSSPEVHIQVLKYDGLRKQPAGNDEARLIMNITADLSSVFSWNTKQLFVFVAAEYATSKNSRNQISLWDKIITSKEDAKFQHYKGNKYAFIDQGNNLRGLEFNLTMYWNVMPITGGMSTYKRVITGFHLSNDYH
eukprot:c23009_g1_i1 orf=539-1042(+)